MREPAIALKRALRAGGVSTGLIKGEASSSPEIGLVPGFSASGQDVWLPQATHFGPGLVLSAVGARCGKVFQADGQWSVVANTVVLTPQRPHCPRFLWYLVNDENFWEKGGTAQPYVRVPETLARHVWLPSCPAQRAIADYLDTETARIDTLIAKKQQLTHLLTERRQTVITAAVTGELPVPTSSPPRDQATQSRDPGTPPGGGGVRRSRLRRVAVVLPGQSPPSDVVVPIEEGTSAFLQGNAEFGAVSPVPRQGCAAAPRTCQPGDILLSVRAPVGALNIADQAYGIGRGLCAIRPIAVQLRFLWWALHASRPALAAASVGSTFDAVTADDVLALSVPVPAATAQVAIADYLDTETARIDTIVRLTNKQIELLRERRQALITAAVTGELDIPGVAA